MIVHSVPLKWYAPYRLTGMGHTGICGMGHTVLEVNNEELEGFGNKGCYEHWFMGDIDALQLLLSGNRCHFEQKIGCIY